MYKGRRIGTKSGLELLCLPPLKRCGDLLYRQIFGKVKNKIDIKKEINYGRLLFDGN